MAAVSLSTATMVGEKVALKFLRSEDKDPSRSGRPDENVYALFTDEMQHWLVSEITS
jgi:hypothetical protein